MTTAPIVLHLAPAEGHYLRVLTEDLIELLSDAEAASTRLTPDAYPDDPDASAAFRTATHADLQERRRHDARTVIAGLSQLPEEDAEPQTVTVTIADLDAWLRTLAALRLVLAERLGVVDNDVSSLEDPRLTVYDWIGYRLEHLIDLADRRDADTSV